MLSVRSTCVQLQDESRLNSVMVEHLYGFERIFPQILAYKIELFEDIAGGRYDMATDSVGLKYIEEFTGACPD